MLEVTQTGWRRRDETSDLSLPLHSNHTGHTRDYISTSAMALIQSSNHVEVIDVDIQKF